MRPIFLTSLVSVLLICSCSDTARRGQVTADAIVYFSAPGEPRVHVYGVGDSHRPQTVATDYGENFDEPLYLYPGAAMLTYSCPNDKVRTYTTISIELRSGTYGLYCDSEHRLGVKPLPAR
jgi:hypothetical protein